MNISIVKMRFLVVTTLVVIASSMLFLGVLVQGMGTIGTIQSTESTAAVTIYLFMEIEGETQGIIEGPVTKAGHEGEIEVLSYSHSMWIPTDAYSGAASGGRRYQSFTIVKELDKSSPKLAMACVNGENLLSVKMMFYQPSLTGQEVHYYTILLEDALIVSIRAYMPPDPLGAPIPMEEVSFNYGSITWTEIVSGVEFQDNWTDTRV